VQLDKCPAKISKALKGLRKKAGKVRDIDVHLDLLKTALPSKISANRDATDVRDKLREKLRKILQAKRDRQLRSLLDAVAEAAPVLETKLPMLAEGAAQSTPSAHDAHLHAQRVRKLFLQWTRRVPEDEARLHRLRINTKKLRYSLEPLEQYKEAAELAAKFKQVQDAIGSWHDWATLEQLAERELESSDAVPICATLQRGTGREYRKALRAAESVRAWMTPVASVQRQPRGGNRSQPIIRKAG
jgi:CHAD domain-containing protein